MVATVVEPGAGEYNRLGCSVIGPGSHILHASDIPHPCQAILESLAGVDVFLWQHVVTRPASGVNGVRCC